LKNNCPFIEKRSLNCQIRLLDTSNIIEQNKYYDNISMTEARNMALAAQMDLVCFKMPSDNKLAFYQIMNFGKWNYNNMKKKKQQKNTRKETKEIRVSAVIDAHDLEYKIKQANKFLDNGNDVIFTMKLKGRQMAHASDARIKIMEIANMCENSEITNKKLDGNNYFCVRVVYKKA